VGGGAAGFNATPLIDRDVDDDRARLHLLDHRLGDQAWFPIGCCIV
jgi:hypothetical protein